MKYDSVIWDLDGTLLDTLADLTASTNAALAAFGYPPRTLEQLRQVVGNGAANQIRKSLPEDAQDFDEVLAFYRAHYRAHCNEATRPYPGILEALDALKARGIRMAVVSNKPDPATKALCQAHFGGRLDLVLGECEGIRRKPAPDSVLRALELLGGSAPVYIGDSEVDVATARNAGMDCICVGWGFRPEETLRDAGAAIIVPDTDALMTILLEDAP
jgi:phosphoglycolate phosphatase